MKENVDISLIVPMYNEQEVIDMFFDKIQKVMKSINSYTYEILCVDDGSKDNTLDILKKYAKQDERIKIISFSKNFHKEQALYAGLEHCAGRVAIPIDADLQDPPELILKFIEKWEEGYDVVYGIREDRKSDTFLKRLSAIFFYKTYNFIAEDPIPYNTGDFRLITRKVIDAIKTIKEKKIFMKGIFSWVGFKSIGIPYKRPERTLGKTKWNYWRLWNFSLDGITSTTTLPLRIWTYIGFLLSILSFFYVLFIVFRTLIFGIELPGYASLISCVLFLGGVQLLVLGVFGEYIGRILIEVKNRPLYIINERINFDK